MEGGNGKPYTPDTRLANQIDLLMFEILLNGKIIHNIKVSFIKKFIHYYMAPDHKIVKPNKYQEEKRENSKSY